MRGARFALLIVCLVGCSSPAEPTPAIPCDVDAVLVDVCQTCHTSPPKNGAPIALVTYADTQAPYTQLPTYDHVPTWKVMGDTVESGWMPQPWPGLTFTSDQRATLLAWVKAGAPSAAAGTTCP